MLRPRLQNAPQRGRPGADGLSGNAEDQIGPDAQPRSGNALYRPEGERGVVAAPQDLQFSVIQALDAEADAQSFPSI